MVSVPVRAPMAVGVKAMVSVQLAPAARAVPQLLDWEKSPAIEMLEMLSVAVPLLVSAMACVALVVFTFWFAKVSDDGDRAASDATPVPVRATVGVAPKELLFKISVPVRLPVAVGVKLTLTEQLAPMASVAPQLLV